MEYNQDGIKIRRSTELDILFFKDKLRKSDVEEIWASHNHVPESALEVCVKDNIYSYTVEGKEPIAIFGINPTSLLGTDAVIWCLATDELEKIQRRFLKNSRLAIDEFLELYPFLYNYVDVKNVKSIKWLRWLGATIEDPLPYGVEQQLFHRFFFKRK